MDTTNRGDYSEAIRTAGGTQGRSAFGTYPRHKQLLLLHGSEVFNLAADVSGLKAQLT